MVNRHGALCACKPPRSVPAGYSMGSRRRREGRWNTVGPLSLAVTFAAFQLAGGCSTPAESGPYRPGPGSGGGADGGTGVFAPPGSLPDADGDGFPDIAEAAAGTDPNDPTSRIPEDDFFVVLPYQGPVENRTLRFSTDIALGDVMFLVDTTSSMEEERQNLIAGLVNVIIPGIEAQIPNVHFAAAGFDDYPVTGFGRDFDVPFYSLASLGPRDADVGAWSLPAACDVGWPDRGAGARRERAPRHPRSGRGSSLPQRFHVGWKRATSRPFGSPPPAMRTRVAPVDRFPVAPVPRSSTVRPVLGTRAFARGALPIVVLIGDAPFHNGPSGTAPYPFPTPSYDDAVTALNAIGARVLPIFSGDPIHIDDYHRIATDTGAVRADGSPLTFALDPSGAGLDQTVVNGVAELVGGSPQDVSTRKENRTRQRRRCRCNTVHRFNHFRSRGTRPEFPDADTRARMRRRSTRPSPGPPSTSPSSSRTTSAPRRTKSRSSELALW